MSGVSVVLHVGLPKTGTTFLQGLLATHRDRLLEGGVLYPLVRPGAMFHGAVEIRGSAAKFGLDPAEIAGTWASLCQRARDYDGTTVLGHEVLAGATPDQIAAAVGPLHGLEVHVVVTARDLGRQATAHWQEEVKLGATFSFADFEREQLRADTGRDQGPDAGGVRPHFWHAQDFADALRRWSADLPAERVHLVIGPTPGSPTTELWRRFAAAAGVDPAVLDAGQETPGNPSLGSAEIALLRAVNAALAGRLDARDRNRVVKRGWAEAVLATRPGPRPRTPAALAAVFDPVTRDWVAETWAAGYAIHGSVDDLDPVLAGPGEPEPDVDLPPGADASAIAGDLVAEVERRRTRSPKGHGGLSSRFRRRATD